MANVLVPILGLAANVLSQLICVRIFPKLGILRSVFIGFATGGTGVFLSEVYLFTQFKTQAADALSLLAANMIIYFSLGYCYFHFINLGITARRIRILRELHASGEGLSLNELLEKYNAGDMIDRRVERLLNSGQIICRDGKYHTGKPAMLLMSLIIVAMKRFILGKKSEFD